MDQTLPKILALFKHLDSSSELQYRELIESLKALDDAINTQNEIWGLFMDAKTCYYRILNKSSLQKTEFTKHLMNFLNYLDQLNESLEEDSSEILREDMKFSLLHLNNSISGLLAEKLASQLELTFNGAEVYIALEGLPKIGDLLAPPKV